MVNTGGGAGSERAGSMKVHAGLGDPSPWLSLSQGLWHGLDQVIEADG